MANYNKQRTIRAKGLRGNNIYHFKGRYDLAIFYDKFTKKAYIISDYDAPLLYAYQYRVAFCLMAGGAVALFTKNYSIAAIVCAAMFIVTTVLFRIFFINKLPVNDKFELPESKGLIKDLASKYTFNGLVIAIMLFASAAASLLFNQLFRGIEGTKSIIIYVCIGAFSIISIFIAFIMYIKKKENL